MVIKVVENSKGKELKAANMLKFEYFIANKAFEEPMTGSATGKDGEMFDWNLFSLNVKEFKSIDENTGETVTVQVNDKCSFFKSSKSFIEPVADIPVGVDFKVTQVPVEGKSYQLYVVERLDGEAESVNVAPAVVEVPAAKVVETGVTPAVVTKITGLKMAQIPVDQVITMIKAEFPALTDEEITKVYVEGQ